MRHSSFPFFKLFSIIGLILDARCTMRTNSAYVTSFRTGRLFAHSKTYLMFRKIYFEIFLDVLICPIKSIRTQHVSFHFSYIPPSLWKANARQKVVFQVLHLLHYCLWILLRICVPQMTVYLTHRPISNGISMHLQI